MKYAEYQVWFHAFNNAVLGLSQRKDIMVSDIPHRADDIANFCLEKFKAVEVPETPDLGSALGGIDLKNVVESTVKEAMKGSQGGKHKR